MLDNSRLNWNFNWKSHFLMERKRTWVCLLQPQISAKAKAKHIQVHCKFNCWAVNWNRSCLYHFLRLGSPGKDLYFLILILFDFTLRWRKSLNMTVVTWCWLESMTNNKTPLTKRTHIISRLNRRTSKVAKSRLANKEPGSQINQNNKNNFIIVSNHLAYCYALIGDTLQHSNTQTLKHSLLIMKT